MNWQPIASAPRDGSPFLGCSITEIDREDVPIMWQCRYDADMAHFHSNWDGEPLYDLTHWMPLPEPPA